MGGGFTSRNVGDSSGWDVGHSESYGSYSSEAEEKVGRTSATSDTSPRRNVETEVANPIALGIDVTGSMGDAAFTLWDKMPLLFGQLKLQEYCEEPAVSFFAVGDYRAGDKSPLQVCDFAEGDGLDDWISKIFVEHGGGGSITESYELAAYYYLRHCKTPGAKRGFFFTIGDEAPYSTVEAKDAKSVFGDESAQTASTPSVWTELSKKMEVIHIHIPYRGRSGTTQEVGRRWREVLPEGRVLPLKDPKGVVDLVLGAVALLNGTRTLDNYLGDLRCENGIREEPQTPERIEAIKDALAPLWTSIQEHGLPKEKKKVGLGRVKKIKKVMKK